MFESTGWVLEEAENKFDALMASVVRPDRKLNDSDELVSLLCLLDLCNRMDGQLPLARLKCCPPFVIG